VRTDLHAFTNADSYICTQGSLCLRTIITTACRLTFMNRYVHLLSAVSLSRTYLYSPFVVASFEVPSIISVFTIARISATRAATSLPDQEGASEQGRDRNHPVASSAFLDSLSQR
jgi:hypothetical protein